MFLLTCSKGRGRERKLGWEWKREELETIKRFTCLRYYFKEVEYWKGT